MNESAMANPADRHLYLPKADRSFWKCGADFTGTLRYLAWGRRDFAADPIPVSCHDGWVCAVIEEGSPVLDAASVAHRLTPGALAFMGPDCAYGWKSSDSGPCRILLWMWSGFSNPALAAEPRSACRIRLLDRGGRKTFRMLHDLCRGEILRREPSVGYLDGCRMMFEETIRRELPGSGQAAPPASGFRQQAEAWMASHLDSKEPVARLCDYLDLSQSTLYRRFLGEFGVSPLARFQELRMREAKRLLAGGGATVKEVAFRLGYSHFNDFSRAYRKHCGRCPSLDR